MRIILKIKFLNKIYILFFLLSGLIAQSQLAEFSFSIVKTNETCESNGSLSFTVENTIPGSIITYSIYLLPNTVNPVNVTTQNNYTGLNSGSYLVIATQNSSGQTNSQQLNVTILDQVVALQYQLQSQNAVCLNNGKITVTVTQGVAVNYEIIGGPILKPLQTSNLFTGLAAGVYLVRVYDSCGNGVVQTFTLFESPSSINIAPVNTITVIDCEHAIINQTITAGGGVIFYPIIINYSITLPSGQTEVVSQILTSGNDTFVTISQNIPVAVGEIITYTLTILDGCGTTFTGSGTLSVPISVPELISIPNGCGTNNYTVQNATNVVVMEAPGSFLPMLPYTVATSGNNEYPLINYPPGQYELQITNLCGTVSSLSFTISAAPVGSPVISVLLGCQNGSGSLKISDAVDLTSVQLLQAPISAGFVLPMDVSSLLYGNPLALNMNNLPVGVYVFSVVNACGVSYNLNTIIKSYEEVKTVNVVENCGSFDLFLNHTTTPSLSMIYQLQKYFSNGNYWGHPITGESDDALNLSNNTTKYNIASSGHFRIIGKNFIYGNGGSSVNCIVVIDTFDFYSFPKINGVFSFACNAEGLDVFVDAVGINGLKYKVISKNGLPFIIDNLTNPLFTNLTAGIYTFTVEDSCSNILIGDFEVGSTTNFPVLAENVCPNQNATLAVADFNFLSYQWWKGTDTSAILSTTHSLNLPNFNPVTDSGMYHVRVYYNGSPNSCIDVQIDWLIDQADYIVSAGANTTKQFCENPGLINLLGLLEGNPDLDGIWTDLSNTGLLVDSMWNASNLNPGTYTFKYTVSGNCGETDAALLQINTTNVPKNIKISGDSLVCSFETITLTTSFIAGANYFWQGPNNFSSSLQNLFIENATSANSGLYTLIVKIGTCESAPAVFTVEVKNLPKFVLMGNCVRDNTDYELYVEREDKNENSDAYSYSWNGPSGFLGSSNPISILGKQTGIYNVIVTDKEGCTTTLTREVKATVCKIPKGISPNDDGANDSFDLTGFRVKKLIVYSRYGRIVYEKQNYINEWYGQDYDGRKLPSATYYYYIKTEAGEELVGWVYVLR